LPLRNLNVKIGNGHEKLEIHSQTYSKTTPNVAPLLRTHLVWREQATSAHRRLIQSITGGRKDAGGWPKEYFEQGSNISHILARKKSTSSLRRKRSESSSLASSTTPSDQKPKEEKIAQYRNPRYKIVVETKGSYMTGDHRCIQASLLNFT
jgi:hypothetical protein